MNHWKISILGMTLCLMGAQNVSFANECCPPVKKCCPEMPEVVLSSARGCPCECGLYSSVDFLYWRGQNAGFAFAFHNQEASPFSVIGEVIRLDEKWKPGFRVALGWNTLHDSWDVRANWTYYHNHSSRSLTVPIVDNEALGLFSLWHRFSVAGPFSTSNAAWILNHNMFDLELGRDYYVGCKLSFRPHIGLRGGTLYQTFRAHYEGPNNNPPNLIVESSFRATNDYWGVGPRFGVEGNWNFWEGFSIFGNAAGALLYGNADITEKETIFQQPQQLLRDIMDFKDDFHQLAPQLQVLLGLSWGHCFCNDMYFALKAGWEVNYFWNQFHLINTFGGVQFPLTSFIMNQNVPITLEGLTVQAKLDF